MKKKIMLIVTVIFVIAAVFAIAGINSYKCFATLSSLEEVAEMDEADVNSLLMGRDRAQLVEEWGEPDSVKSNEDIWIINQSAYLLVNSNNNGEVVICGLKYILLPDEITEIEVGGYYNGSVIKSGDFVIQDFISFKDWFAQLSLEQKEFADGKSPAETYAGGDSYEFDINNGALYFTYVDHGNGAYVVYENEWYEVLNPSEPPLK